ncbi:MAG: hypothetical protein M3R53_00320 [Candidatus Eremiobacteraeota bacterium]|nr:hypothetical protein [Candidatus Eremiobacteraeota bacterium]
MKTSFRMHAYEEAEYRRQESDDAADIRYSLTALGEALVHDPAARLWYGLGSCAPAAGATESAAAGRVPRRGTAAKQGRRH